MHRIPARLGASLAIAILALVPRLAAGQQRDSTTVVCKDGTTDQGGGCGAHGGVDPVATKSTQAGARDARRPPRTGATLVICGDGTQSTAGNDACIHHGGIKSAPGQQGEVKAALRMEDYKSSAPKPAAAAMGKPAPVPAAPRDSAAAPPPAS